MDFGLFFQTPHALRRRCFPLAATPGVGSGCVAESKAAADKWPQSDPGGSVGHRGSRSGFRLWLPPHAKTCGRAFPGNG